jgi:hypothetical protein
MFLAYDRWVETASGATSGVSFKPKWRSAVLVAVLVLPIELIHHLVHGALGRYLVVASTLALGIGILLKIRPAAKGSAQQRSFEPTGSGQSE